MGTVLEACSGEGAFPWSLRSGAAGVQLAEAVKRPSMKLVGSSSSMNALARLAIHTITTKPWQLEEAIVRYSAAGVSGISIWVEALGDRAIGSA